MLELVLAGLMAGMVVNVCWQIVTRFVLHDPSSWTEELARYILIWAGLLGAAYALPRRMHLAIDLVGRRAGEGTRRKLERISWAIVAAFSLFVPTLGGGRLVALTLELEQTSAALGWRLGFVYLVVPVSGLLMLFYTLTASVERRREQASDLR